MSVEEYQLEEDGSKNHGMNRAKDNGTMNYRRQTRMT